MLQTQTQTSSDPGLGDEPFLFQPQVDLLRQLTPLMVDALHHASRCGYLVRYIATSRRLYTEDIWTHWDCIDNHWWAPNLTVQRLIALGCLRAEGTDEAWITEVGRDARLRWAPKPPETVTMPNGQLTNTG